MIKLTRHIARPKQYIVIHHCGCVCSAKNSISWLNNISNTVQASADYFIDEVSTEVYNSDLDNYYSWHCGDGAKVPHQKVFNRNSIGIEMCNQTGPPDWLVSDKVINNTIKLVKSLQSKYNIPDSNIIFHFDVSRKNCPFPQTRARFMELFKTI